MKKRFLTLVMAALMVGTSSSVVADAHNENKAKSEKQAKTVVMFRQSLLQLIRSNMGPLGAMAKGNIPMDAAVIELNSERIEFLAGMMHDYFALDTSGYPVDTDAKSDIWKNNEDFSQKIDNMVSAASALNALVKAGKDEEFRRGIGDLGGTCKACHDEYKAD